MSAYQNAYFVRSLSVVPSSSLNKQESFGGPRMENSTALIMYVTAMRTIKRSPNTIEKRLEVLNRLAVFLDEQPLLEATTAQLYEFQSRMNHLAAASIDIYTRHLKAFYGWANDQGLIPSDPAAKLGLPTVRRGLPHPTPAADLKLILHCAPTNLRLAYVLAAFAGLRCGEVTRLRYVDCDMDQQPATALIHGKGGKQRRVPLLDPVVRELNTGRRGFVVLTKSDVPFSPHALSCQSSKFLTELGMTTTLHSMRHFYATTAGRITRDPLLIRDLLGHSSVATTEIYMESDLAGIHHRLTDFADVMNSVLGRRDHLSVAPIRATR